MAQEEQEGLIAIRQPLKFGDSDRIEGLSLVRTTVLAGAPDSATDERPGAIAG